MTDCPDIRALYEISLEISPQGSLEATAEAALRAYLEHLNCSVGAVLEVCETNEGVEYESVVTVPESAASVVSAAIGRLNSSSDTVPLSGTLTDGTHFCVLELPAVGALVLGRREGTLPEELSTELESLNEKFAEACTSTHTEQRLREERDRFEAVVDSIPEPIATVVVEDGIHRVTRVNTSFEETFGSLEPASEPTDLRAFVTATEETLDDEWVQRLTNGEPVRQSTTSETRDGFGEFVFCGVPLDRRERLEYVAIYVDITEQKTRERNLERLYWRTEGIIAGGDRNTICMRALETIDEILAPTDTAIHCYERDEHVLNAVATTTGFSTSLGGEPLTEVDGSPLWDVYEQGEPVHIDELDGESNVSSLLAFPLGSHGVVTLLHTEPEAFSDQDRYFTQLLSTVLKTALDREKNERGLRNVQQVVRETANQESHEEMAKTVLEWLPSALDLPLAGLWRYSPPERCLEPLGQTEQGKAMIEEPPTFSGEGSIAWQQYVDGESTIIDDVASHPETHNPETPIGSEIIAPIDEFGVLVAGSPHTEDFSDLEAEIIDTLTTNLRTVTRLLDRRQEIRLLDQVLARILRHNLRNELTSIRGYAGIIEQTASGAIAEKAAMIVDSCADLEQTAKHAHEMREIVQSRTQTQRLSLATVTRLAAETLAKEYPDATIDLEVDCSWEVVAHTRLQTAIAHLIRNGIEHTQHDQARVAVTVGTRDGIPMVSVADDGPGIPPHEIEILEEQRESSLAHGSGAGLWTIDRVVEYSDAILEFEVEDGTTATILFPAHQEDNGR